MDCPSCPLKLEVALCLTEAKAVPTAVVCVQTALEGSGDPRGIFLTLAWGPVQPGWGLL